MTQHRQQMEKVTFWTKDSNTEWLFIHQTFDTRFKPMWSFTSGYLWRIQCSVLTLATSWSETGNPASGVFSLYRIVQALLIEFNPLTFTHYFTKGSIHQMFRTKYCSSCVYYQTKSMDQSPSQEANSSSASKEILDIVQNPNSHYCVHISSTFILILSQIYTVRIILFSL